MFIGFQVFPFKNEVLFSGGFVDKENEVIRTLLTYKRILSSAVAFEAS
jgi:hypothetical protein